MVLMYSKAYSRWLKNPFKWRFPATVSIFIAVNVLNIKKILIKKKYLLDKQFLR